jgi:hypothetical protein
VRLGTCVAPTGTGKPGQTALTVEIDGRAPLSLRWGELRRIPLGEEETVSATLVPARGADVGGGRGEKVTRTLRGGVVGLIFDGRGRPLVVPGPEQVAEWHAALELYPPA